MKKTLYIILAIAAAAYVIISAMKNQWNPFKWFAGTPSTPPADGTMCTLPDNTAGEYKNGVCVRKIDINPPPETVIRRRVKCYMKPAGTSCNPRIYDSLLGWGVLYSQTTNTCCYIF